MLADIIARAFEEAEAERGPVRTSRVVMRAFQMIDELPEHERRWVTEQALRRVIHEQAREFVKHWRRDAATAPRPFRPARPPAGTGRKAPPSGGG